MASEFMYRARKRIRRKIHASARREGAILIARTNWAEARGRVWRYRFACDAALHAVPITVNLVNLEYCGREALYHGDVERMMQRDADIVAAMDQYSELTDSAVSWLTGDTALVCGQGFGDVRINLRAPPSFRAVRLDALDTVSPARLAGPGGVVRMTENRSLPLVFPGEQDGRWWLDENEYPVRALASFEKCLPDGLTIYGLHIGSPC